MKEFNLISKRTGSYIFAFLFFIFAIAFTFTINGYTLGDEILNFLRLPSWSVGNPRTHYTFFYSVALIIVSYLLIPKKKS